MTEQRQHDNVDLTPRSSAPADDAAGSAARLAGARAELSGIFAAADAILDNLRLDNAERFLEQVRQSGGQ